MTRTNSRWTVYGTAALGLGLGVAALLPGSPALRAGAALGWALAFLNAGLCWAALAWGFRKSDKVFFAAFFGGMLWKFLVLGAAFLALARSSAVSPAAALVAMALGTLAFNALEIVLSQKTFGSIPPPGRLRESA